MKTTMKAAVLYGAGPPSAFVIEEVPVPEPGRDDVLVKVGACGVSYRDVVERNGTYKRDVVYPSILGLEISGTVTAVDWMCQPKRCTSVEARPHQTNGRTASTCQKNFVLARIPHRSSQSPRRQSSPVEIINERLKPSDRRSPGQPPN